MTKAQQVMVDDLRKEIDRLRKQLAEAQKEKTVFIEVGGDHGDGNVEVVRKSKGVRVVIKDWDNAEIEDEQDEPKPQIREYEA